MDKISVVIPVYKVEKYLERCVNSVRNQSYENLEIVLVDDGSPDHSGEICDKLAKDDKRIKVIHKENGGLSDARNAGIEAATGDYVAFIDSDDWYDPDMLALLHRLSREHNAEIAECSYRSVWKDCIRAETNCSGRVFEFTPAQAIESNLDWKYCKPVAWNKLYRADVIGTTRYPVGKLHEDEFTTHLFYLAAKKIVYVDVALLNYERRNLGSITASFKPKNLDACEAFLQKTKLTWERPDLAEIAKKAGDNYAYVLLDRVEKCEQTCPDCPELKQTLSQAEEAFEGLKVHGLEKSYIRRMTELFTKYGVHTGGGNEV